MSVSYIYIKKKYSSLDLVYTSKINMYRKKTHLKNKKLYKNYKIILNKCQYV